jgi:metallophosphoesterase superfamily enzyme
MLFQFLEQDFQLLPEHAIIWRNTNTLIVSDLHLGKGGHFRKNGVAMPIEVNLENLWKLSGLLLDHKPERLLLLGDLFHSSFNKEWDQFADVLANFPEIETVLVRGNHDILPEHHKCRDHSGRRIKRRAFHL